MNIDWPHLIYSGIFLLILITNIASRRDLSASKILRYISIWLTIALVTIALYSYRYEFYHFKNRMLRELNPSAAHINEKGQITINMSSNGHFYINSKVNGYHLKFMIDTGASDISLSLKDAKNIGINTNNLHYNRKYQTANGVILGARVNLRELKIGDITFHNIPASISNTDMGTSLLGMSFLKQCKRYEFYQDKLVLTF